MRAYFPVIVLLPLLGFLILTLGGRRLHKNFAAWVACSTVGLSALLTVSIALGYLFNPYIGDARTVTLWEWIARGGLQIGVTLRLDTLSMVMASVVTVIGFLIHVYSTEYMREDDGHNRFFAYLNLFVGLMLVLVFADNLALLLVGWEGVGMCSYLLIGFWYRKPENVAAARKAFVMTRIGDTALMLGILLIFLELGSLNIVEIHSRAADLWAPGSTIATVAAILILVGAIGKSAQLPLQTWLPDAMAGPTPVSALIHAATMVTAGVYLIARLHGIFELAPDAMRIVAIVGALTVLVAGLAALVQTDIKRILAYSTISQLGYMFVALGVGAWSGALFHFMTHAWFKALLFLAAGAVIHALGGEQDIRRMGGLRHRLPVVFWTFVVGAACLAAVPLVTSGFYSKEKILWDVWSSPHGGPWLWALGIIGAFITALYSTRLIALTFFGPCRTDIHHTPGWRIHSVLVILAIWSVLGGGVELPHTFAHFTLFSDYVSRTIPEIVELPAGLGLQLWILLGVASLTVVLGIVIGAWFYGRGTHLLDHLCKQTPALRSLWLNGWGFDGFYARFIAGPFSHIAEVNRNDAFDRVTPFTTSSARILHAAIARTQHGSLRRYALGVTSGTIILILIILFE